MEKCIICGKEFKAITHTHLKKTHGISSVKEYREIENKIRPVENKVSTMEDKELLKKYEKPLLEKKPVVDEMVNILNNL